MKVSLRDLLPAARANRRAVPGFNIFGIDEATRVIAAAERLNRPVILMTNKELVKAVPVEVWGAALGTLAENATVPVCVHLDHTYNLETIHRAIRGGYSSVMWDGSQKPYEENLSETRRVVELARAAGVSVEAEIGSVSYNEAGNPIRHQLTDPEEAGRFARESGVDALAVSVGTVHKLLDSTARVDHELLAAIAAAVPTPLVIHGTSGVPEADLRRMASGVVAKFNIGTLLRRAWGETLREEITGDPGQFDRLTLTKKPLDALEATAERMLRLLGDPTSSQTAPRRLTEVPGNHGKSKEAE